MDKSIIKQLILNDWVLNKKIIMVWFFIAILGVGTAFVFSGIIAANVAFSLILTAIIGLAINLMSQTILLDKVKGTRTFALSLPVTFKQYIKAKMLANLSVFFAMWLILCSAILYLAFSKDILPLGSIPLLTLTLTAILPVYSIILSICISTHSTLYTAMTAAPCAIASSGYLWASVELPAIGDFVLGDQAVWNGTIFSIIGMQIAIIILAPSIAISLHYLKKDFLN